jgi:hypothetical protein
MLKIVKKIWYGDAPVGTAKITLRDYWVKRAIVDEVDLIVQYKKQKMYLSPRQLENPLNKRQQKSKIGNFDYELWDYKWNPKQNE